MAFKSIIRCIAGFCCRFRREKSPSALHITLDPACAAVLRPGDVLLLLIHASLGEEDRKELAQWCDEFYTQHGVKVIYATPRAGVITVVQSGQR